MSLELSVISKELHKPYFKKFTKRPVIATYVNEIWGSDLADLQEWADRNKGYRYIITIIDVLSKYAWAFPLKDKKGSTITEVFKKLFKQVKPKYVWSDQGSEYYNKELKNLFNANDVTLYSSYGDHKSAVVERFNRTLKNRMYEVFTAKNNRDWVNILSKLLYDYNKTVHRTIKMSPIDAINPKNFDLLLGNFNATVNKTLSKIKKTNPKYKKGDFIRLARIKGLFERGYDANWTLEVYKIAAVHDDTSPIQYDVAEFDDTPVTGRFYEPEIQKTEYPDYRLIEKELKTRTVNRKKQTLVKYLGWPSKYNEWRNNDELDDI